MALKVNAVGIAELPENYLKDIMRHTAVMLLLAATICGLSGAAKTSRMRFIKPIWWLRGSGGGQARSEAAATAGTGRGFMKKWMHFKNMFQQPQSHVIIITQPTTEAPTTSPTTTGTTTVTATGTAPSGRDNEEFAGKMHADIGDEMDADYDGDAYEVPVVVGLQGVNGKMASDGQQVHRRRLGNHNGARFNKPPLGSVNGVNINNLPAGDNIDDIQPNGRRKNRKPHNKNRIKNSNSEKSRNSDKHGNGVINGNSQANNDKNHNTNGILNSNGNTRIQSILNALRRQPPIIYSH